MASDSGHTPTRVDIRTEGWTTGTDMPLPRDCQTALCIHKDHQLKGEWSFGDGTRAGEKDGRAAPSASIYTDPHRVHIEKVYRKWWHFGAFSMIMREVPCQDMECDKEHITTPVASLPPLDLPTVSVRRGGLRFYPELPECSFHITRRGMHWQIEVRFHGTQAWHKPPQLRFWRRKRAENMRAWLMSHQQNIRAMYIDRANARQSF